ncbi:uncharacterized protein LACBIDRAFT_297676 [Laccaria bicolor S238N-H82]|uniref:Predicted protein n=1 Tax=Laccaria bicolor (strain S238N-H82 / ATCC MYA-4686) TaxID=486041 RepID=B0DBR7_LACBS|nr:uncharacterized protein LACBIDRAFT_297676 [Laccaria bicolor S238N-H82]EDR08047.1 predicted protein [Laccaria bicolor S238N-H82]|eukprot:XP_001881117.1 predicted protein [Laccaria bicolor S238N-H82]
MPPLPSTLAQETQNLISSLDRRQKHINEVQIPALRQCTGPLSLQQKLAEELKDAIDAHSRQIEVNDQQGEKARRELGAIVDTSREALDRMRKDTRSALLISKKAIESQRTAHRDELLSLAGILKEEGNQSNYGASNEKFGEDALMKANADVTDALRRTIAAMQNELERSVLSNQMLESSSASLHATSSQHDKLSSFMITSKHLVTALEKSDWLDRVIIISAFMFFLLVVLFVLKQRFVG